MKKLAGHAAEPKFINEIADLATNYHDKLRLDKIRAYHFGDNYLVSEGPVGDQQTPSN